MKPAELARELGVSRQAIHDLIDRGILQRGEDGTIDIELAKVAIANRVRPSGKTAEAVSGAPSAMAPLPPPVAAPAEANVDAASSTSYHVARTLHEAERARMAKMERMKMERTLVEAEPAVSAVFTAFRQLRDTVMPVGRRVSGKVAAMTDAREIQLVIEEELRVAFVKFAEAAVPGIVNRMGAQLTTTVSGEIDQ